MTFVVAMSVLGFFLVLELAAVIGHFLPKFRQTVVESAVAASVQPAASAATLPPSPSQPGTVQPPQQPQHRANEEAVLRMAADSDRAYRIGDFEAAMKSINEADALLPDDPGILLRRARLFESMAQPAEAVADYERVLSLPGLDPANKSKYEKKLAMLAGAAAPAVRPTPKQAPAFAESSGGTELRDDVGLQPGASLGIVDARLREGTPGTKVLRIAIKARPGQTIDTRQMKLHVFFYEKDETGEVLLTESKVVSQWISPPVDWKDNEPELLDVTYTLPGSDSSAGTPGRQFVGYIVGIYYNGELQDTRADPGPLVKKFPLPLYLKQEAQ